MKVRLAPAFLLVLVPMFGCGSTSKAPTAPVEGNTAGEAAKVPAGSTSSSDAVSWSDDWSHEQKASFMKQRVVPRMSKVFQDYDASHYGQFGCRTCHGPQFREPKDHLPHLVLKDGQITAFAQQPAVAQFMATKVVPEMAAAMGVPAYDPKTQQGFGCGGCHTIDK